MSDPTAPDRHQRHESTFAEHGRRLDCLEDEATVTRIWRTGNGSPHRGAESRITRLEEGAVMQTDMKKIAAEVVAEYQSTLRAKIKDFAPYLVMLAGVAYTLLTGKPPEVGP